MEAQDVLETKSAADAGLLLEVEELLAVPKWECETVNATLW